MRNRWIGCGLVALFGAGAFWDGLYSPAQQVAGTALMAVLVVLAGGAFGGGGEAGAGLTWWEAVWLALFGGAVLVSLGSPVAAGSAAHGPVVAAGWLLAYWLGRRFAAAGWMEQLLCWLWAVLGPVILFGGLAAMSYLPPHHSGRLASFLGYPIAVGVLGLLGLAGSLPLLQEGRKWAPVLVWANGLAVLLSGSRGVWAVGLVLAGYFFWADRRLLRSVWWPLVAALAGALWVGPAVAQRTLFPAIFILLAIGLTVLAAGWFQRRWVLVGGVVAWLAGAALAPGWGWLLGRAAALPLTEGSSVERMTFLADGFRLAGAWPWGAGYRAWTALQLQGASYAYYSAEVHSAALDLALAFGWVGGAAFLALLARFGLGLRGGWAWSPWRLAGLAGLGALGLHALLDWDLSYGLFALPLWLGFGLAGGGAQRRPWGQGA
ncbi:MAG: hypothetical protein K0R39_3197, partial [Symbiobacteriaceae bacterium]|nr:hypothetical protein [Symbiobacteriaceae bacterium]